MSSTLSEAKTLPYFQFGSYNTRKLVFIHGWGYSYKFFKIFINEISKKFNVICISYPGYDGLPEEGYIPMEELSSRLYNTISGLNLKETDYILAHSMGSIVMLGAYRKDILPKIIFCGCPLQLSTPWYAPLILSSKTVFSLLSQNRKITAIFNDIAKQEISQLNSKESSKYDGDAASRTAFLNLIALLRYDPINKLKDLREDTKFVYGEMDQLQKIARTNGLRPYIVPHSGHSPFIDDPFYFIAHFLK